MKAVMFNETGLWTEKLYLSEPDIKEPMENEVLVKIMARPVNPSDEMFIKGLYRQKPEFPQTAGLEGAGIIEKTGSALDRSLTGQHVAFRSKGTWAERINIPAGSFRIVPRAIPFEIACQLTLNSFTAYGLLERAHLRAGQWLLVTAANTSVCRQVIQLASAKGIKVIALVRKAIRKNELLNLGAAYVLYDGAEDMEAQIVSRTEDGANAVLDAVGAALGSKIINTIAPFGRMIIYGMLSPGITSFTNRTLLYRNLKIEGFGIDHWLKSKMEDELNLIWEALTAAVAKGELKLYFDKVFALEDFKEAISAYINTGQKIILK